MNVFNNTTIIGIFNSEKDLGDAIKALQERDFGKEGQELRVLDQTRMSQDALVQEDKPDVIVPPISGSGTPLPAYGPMNQATGSETEVMRENVQRELEKLGLDSGEAAFYADKVPTGNALLIVETDEERTEEALSIMKEANAVQPMAE